jgi:hypothetical protein
MQTFSRRIFQGQRTEGQQRWQHHRWDRRRPDVHAMPRLAVSSQGLHSKPGYVRRETVDYCSVQLDMSVLQQSLAESKALHDSSPAGTDLRQSAVAFLLEETPSSPMSPAKYQS